MTVDKSDYVIAVAADAAALGDGSCGESRMKMKDIVRRDNVNIGFQACQVFGYQFGFARSKTLYREHYSEM